MYVIASAGLVFLAAALAWLGLEEKQGFVAFEIVFAVQMAAFGAAAWWIATRRVAGRYALFAVLGFAVLFRLALLPTRPALSDDMYRYIWDGRVQAAGVNPYRYAPEDDALRPLRDAEAFPSINRRSYARTIYPPGAQALFLLSHAVAGDHVVGMKSLFIAFDFATIALLAWVLRRRGEDPCGVVLYAWHPLPVWEFAQAGHVDAVALTFTVAAIAAVGIRRHALGGVLLGVATLVKFYPAAALPALARDRPMRFAGAMIATIALAYVPYMGVGSRVLGFLPMYIEEEGFRSGDRYLPLTLVRLLAPVPTWAYVALTAALLAVIAGKTLRDRGVHPAAPFGSMLLLLTPHYAWYATWLLPVVCLEFSALWLYVGTIFALRYYEPHTDFGRMVFWSAALAPALVLALRAGARDFIRPRSTFALTPHAPPKPRSTTSVG
jgi:hypothetical protein